MNIMIYHDFKKLMFKRTSRKGAVNANSSLANQDGQDGAESEDIEQGPVSDVEEAYSLREDAIVERVTKNIGEMLDKKVAAILKPVTELSGKFDDMAQRMATVEQRISDLEDVSAGSTPRIDNMEEALKKALERFDSFENQSRRQNVRITGLKEGIEDRDPVSFFEGWIPKVLAIPLARLKIERAHRTGPPVGRNGRDGPRAVLVRLHNYTDKQKILNAARERGEIKVEGRRISFYQDFSAEVIRKRQTSANVRRQLREAGIKYAFVYPAVIKILNQDGSTTSLSNMEEINDFIKTIPK
uniref:LINE-1 type transposase domain-containing protein 1 n=1 Tax=Neogobius melanostomus TaxID=47308 RepID=A0A8C6T6K4_9GOBI